MSQYGARGRAKAGESATRSSPRTTRSARPATTDPAQVVRVLLLDREPATTASPLVIHGRGGPGPSTASTGTFPAGAALRVWRARRRGHRTRPAPGAQLEVLAPDGTTSLVRAARSRTTVVVRPAEPGTRLQLDAQPVGARHVSRRAQGRPVRRQSARVVNRVGLDDYLRGVCRWRCRRAGPARRCGPRRSPRAATRVRRLHPGYGRLRPLRRHPLAGLPRRRGRDRSDQRDHRRRARERSSSRDGTTARSTPSSTRPAAARPRTTSTRSSGRRER